MIWLGRGKSRARERKGYRGLKGKVGIDLVVKGKGRDRFSSKRER